MRNVTRMVLSVFLLFSSMSRAGNAHWMPLAAHVPLLSAAGVRHMENLDRGLVAVAVGTDTHFISWRVLGTDPAHTAFNLYRNHVRINAAPITGASNFLDTAGTAGSVYAVTAIVNGVEGVPSEPVAVWDSPYLTIPLQLPPGGTTPSGESYTYSANDCSVGDLDGDGTYEIVVKWDPSNSKDNSLSGYTGNVFLDAYRLDGTRLWRIDLGVNIRAGAHYTQFIVYDLDSDGTGEVACRTGDGTVDGAGAVIGDPDADWRNNSGYIVTGPEYLTIFNGRTGAAMTTTDFYPNRGSVGEWGDGYGNRCDRFLAGVAYVDGRRPSLIMARGYYGPRSGYSARNEIVAWNWRDGILSQVWYFKARTDGINADYIGQGCHSLSIADVDGDGNDEIIYGSCTIDDDGSPLYTTGLGHGDALHVGDLDPGRPGLEVWQCHEGSASGASFRDAATGAVFFEYENTGDVGRACAADITAASAGCELWASGSPLYACSGESLGSHSLPVNFVVWWDGDDLRELLNSNVITKYGSGTLLTASDCSANNGTKSTPALSADLLGDWREEVLWRTTDSSALRLYTTTALTNRRIYTLMHDSQYRSSIAWQNTAYNQPPHPSFFIGAGMADPPLPQIELVGSKTGGIRFQWWSNLPGASLSDLLNSPDYPFSPSGQSILSRFEAVFNRDDDFGSRTIGWLVPPATGSYTFWVAANETAELRLGTDALAASAAVIATVPTAVTPRQWTQFAEQESAPVALEAGRRYYIELLHKEADGDDHFAVAWRGPGLTQAVIDGSCLLPWQERLLGDVTGNDYVDLDDFQGLAAHWQAVDCAFDFHLDLNDDCIIDLIDAAALVENWLAGTWDGGIATLRIEENEPGFAGLLGTIDSDHAGFSGSGFANTVNAVDAWIEWTVTVPDDGPYTLRWRFANGTELDRSGSVSVAGVLAAAPISFPGTGGWANWSLAGPVEVSLRAGANPIRLAAETGNGLANIDWLEITGVHPTAD